MDPREWIAAWWHGGEPLEPPGDGAFALFSAALVLFAIVIGRVEFVPLLDHFNLALHEAGHLLFRLFGDTASLYGGTLMQFVFPLATTLSFLQRGQALAAAACAAWFCENLRYTAFYVGDARAQQLPLVGGGEHDWFNILSRWGALESDTALAGLLSTLCWLGLGLIWLAVWQLRRSAR